jgi:phosphoribosyl 1,2-cyclic phosphate phosphodiesterase
MDAFAYNADMPDGLTITVLGSGTSHGVPMIACDCAVCTSSDPRNRRTRPSIVIQFDARTLLVDTSPEFRLQCLANNIRRVDAVLYTHHHIDHIAGLDDLRRFNWLQQSVLPCYGQGATLERLRTMFAYVFDEEEDYPSAKPRLALHEINPGAPGVELFGRTVTPIPLLHGKLPVLGFRVGRFAYCTDVSEIPKDSWPLLKDLDVLILDALRIRPHPTHFNLDQAVHHARRIGAKQTYFTHIAHELGHEETNAGLPRNMALGHDGLIIQI